jgi:NADPH-dependent ferric siderophore reductase
MHDEQQKGQQMNSSQPTEGQSAKQIPAFRPYLVKVARTEQLSTSFRRLVFTGDDLQYIGTDGLDQRIKILLPLEGGRWGDPYLFAPDSVERGSWWEQWRALAPEDRNPIRTYTIRSADCEHRELSVDFVIHNDPGPAGTFAQQAEVGSQVVIIGPDRRAEDSSIGIDFHPGQANTILLAGDETAVPAMGGILQGLLDSHWSGQGKALIEVPYADDTTLQLPHPEGFALDWVSRSSGQTNLAHGASLITRVEDYAAEHPALFPADTSDTTSAAALASSGFTDIDVDRELLWEVPEQAHVKGFYAWMAGEAAMVRSLRRILVKDHGIDRSRVAFMGYWRAGKSEM